jgi:cytochrome c5
MGQSGQGIMGRSVLKLAALCSLCLAQVSHVGAADEALSVLSSEAALPDQTGERIYNGVCIACHAPPGLGGAPALGDQAAWAERIAKGMPTLVTHALNGFSSATGIMPRKGGRPDLSDAEVMSAVEYMVQRATP